MNVSVYKRTKVVLFLKYLYGLASENGALLKFCNGKDLQRDIRSYTGRLTARALKFDNDIDSSFHNENVGGFSTKSYALKGNK